MRLNKLMESRHRLLFVDVVGAMVTASTTIFLLAAERIRTGLPTEVLYALGVGAACLACFGMASLWLGMNPSISLRIIACANLSYCALVGTLLSIYRQSVTGLGFIYFGVEIAVVVGLAIWEWRIATSARSNLKEAEA